MVTIIKPSLRENQYLLIRQLANFIEDQWQLHLEPSPYDIPQNLGYVEGNLEGEKLIIENHCYQTTQFRKLHLELAKVGDRLDILHCVMFPRANYDLPIFGVDLVASKMGIGAAIVDLSPVNSDHLLPSSYRDFLQDLPQLDFSQPRALPEWGRIFSEFCLFVRPGDHDEEQLFFHRVQQYLTLHCQIALAKPQISSLVGKAQILLGQHYYCTQQQQNDKTRRVLEKSLGSTWTDRYMSQMLFDCPLNIENYLNENY
ncbi:phycocyanobilin:ferredoxin oxidoreductase [Xenococcus sp. PCC 7305]|uniref:phycocyanobilin:ferredoxin oxidoreductase n=1 Tax=Xenococcus sp. PCC 7305 TaxID=102125 RepID=UPI0002AC25B5|nr:phycocyanobilin:ferredoxin oxidoreductase [Xenococcus sp. PCC 7305]ELS01356.1 phycocyanobilin:ferredoxin oxidoreductase [Xenococcus sp. PCC 7305]